MKQPLIIALSFLCSAALGQNLIPNPSFEEYIELPDQHGQIDRCLEWTGCGEVASTDYFHYYGSGLGDLPSTFAAYVWPHSGDAIAGFLSTSQAPLVVSNYREYLMTPLLSPMEVGVKYTVSFWLTNGFNGHNYIYSSDHIGIRFSTSPLVLPTWLPLGSPHMEIDGQVWQTSWQQYSFEFMADSAYSYLIIGNFVDNSATSIIQQVTNPNGSMRAYYFIDDVSLVAETITDALTGVSVADKRITLFPNPFLESLTINNTSKVSNIIVYNGLGKLLFQRKYYSESQIELNFSNLPSGLYIIVVVDDTGQSQAKRLLKK